jgi:hypothetical protein
MKKPISCAIVATVSALTVLSGLETVSAAPLPVGTAGLKTATVSDVVDVRYRRHRRHHRRNDAIAATIMFGLLSAAIASRYHDDDDYDYDYPSYGYYGGHYRGHHGHHRHHVHAQHHRHHHRH